MSTTTTGSAILNLLTGMANAAVTGLAAAKPPEKGCGGCAKKAERKAQQRKQATILGRRGLHGHP